LGKEIYLTIKDIVKNLTDEEYEMKMENSFVDDLGFDSVNLLYLQVAVEDEFDIKFDPILDDFSEIFKNLKNLCECVERKLGD
jgi:acyl carrier protein